MKDIVYLENYLYLTEAVQLGENICCCKRCAFVRRRRPLLSHLFKCGLILTISWFSLLCISCFGIYGLEDDVTSPSAYSDEDFQQVLRYHQENKRVLKSFIGYTLCCIVTYWLILTSFIFCFLWS